MQFITNDKNEYRHENLTKDEWLEWRKQFIVGEPVPMKGGFYTVEHLKQMGYVGLYKIKMDNDSMIV